MDNRIKQILVKWYNLNTNVETAIEFNAVVDVANEVIDELSQIAQDSCQIINRMKQHASDELIMEMYKNLTEEDATKAFTNENWFVAGFASAEFIHGVENGNGI